MDPGAHALQTGRRAIVLLLLLALQPGCGESSCESDGRIFESGESWTCPDGCSICSCNDGQIRQPPLACGPAVCGNGEIDEGEECDDGNRSNRDACTNDCTAAVCGDGYQGPGEECDDGNDIDDDDCPNDCSPPHCGDGIVQDGLGEECDDGNHDPNDSCPSDPDAESPRERSCQWNTCQDGLVYEVQSDDDNPNPLEECDDGNNDQEDECLQDCVVARCGDGFVARKSARGEFGPEQCDDGDPPEDAVGDECESQPRAYNGFVPCYCGPECTIIECGNGVVAPGLECDDGSAVLDAECVDGCRTECDGDDACLDSCTSGCPVVAGNHENASCTPWCEWNRCGDGHAYLYETNPDNPNDLEECDDGNQEDDDECSSLCAAP